MMSYEDAATVRFYACDRKQRFRTPAEARQSNPVARGARPYRCPFCSWFHVGHTPSMKTLKKVAQAIRVLAQEKATT